MLNADSLSQDLNLCLCAHSLLFYPLHDETLFYGHLYVHIRIYFIFPLSLSLSLSPLLTSYYFSFLSLPWNGLVFCPQVLGFFFLNFHPSLRFLWSLFWSSDATCTKIAWLHPQLLCKIIQSFNCCDPNVVKVQVLNKNSFLKVVNISQCANTLKGILFSLQVGINRSGIRDIMVIWLGKEHDHPNSSFRRGISHTLRKVRTKLFSLRLWVNSRTDWAL